MDTAVAPPMSGATRRSPEGSQVPQRGEGRCRHRNERPLVRSGHDPPQVYRLAWPVLTQLMIIDANSSGWSDHEKCPASARM